VLRSIKSTFLSSTTIASPSQPWLNHLLIVLQLPWHCSVREEFKTQKRAYDKSEDDLKALQSVGQIIGEVLRQLDDEKCTPPPRLSNWAFYTSFRFKTPDLCRSANPLVCSHCQGLERSSLCGRLPQARGEEEAYRWHPCGSRHDHAHHHEGTSSSPPTLSQSFSTTARTKPHGRVVVHA
jgi:hypothetical protein